MTWTTAERTRRDQPDGSGRDADKAIGGMGPSPGNALRLKRWKTAYPYKSVSVPGGSSTNLTSTCWTRDEATEDLGNYIDGFYNLTRRHSELGGLSPVQYETMTKLT